MTARAPASPHASSPGPVSAPERAQNTRATPSPAGPAGPASPTAVPPADGRTGVVPAVLCFIAVVAATWPVTRLIEGGQWWSTGLLAMLAVTLTGIATRALRAPPVLVLLLQLAAGWWALVALMAPGSLTAYLPLAESGRAAQALVLDGADIIRLNPIPAPEGPGLTFAVAALLVLCGWAVDAFAATLRAPILAGIPLLAVLVGTGSSSGVAMPPHYFVMLGLAWLLLLIKPTPRRAPGARPSAIAQSAVLVPAAIALATALGPTLPHANPPALLSGEGFGTGGGSLAGSVQFTGTLDLSQDLRNDSDAPVLRYEETGGSGPMRVLAVHRYADGGWSRDLGAGSQPLPEVVDREDVERGAWQIEVQESNLGAPNIALPHPVTSVDAAGAALQLDQRTGTVSAGQALGSYSAVAAPAEGTLPADVGEGGPSDAEDELLRVDEATSETVHDLLREVLADRFDESDPSALNQIEVAEAIQAHLRSNTYTYSLELAPPTENTNPGEDPLAHFLATRAGYCTHFATAMVMMSRAADIPARLAMGFIPGEQGEGGVRTVVASDAHAWPELYISGLGWTAFEPTPGIRAGDAPNFPVEGLEGDSEPAIDDEEDTPEAEVPELPEEPEAPETDEDTSALPGAAEGATGTPVGLWALGLLALAVALAAVPVAGRRHRLAPLHAARGSASRVEARWEQLGRSLHDAGIAPAPQLTPRQAGRRFDHRLGGTDEVTEAIGVLVTHVEAARYGMGVDTAAVRECGQAVRTVVSAAHARLTWRERIQVALWPRSGRAEIGEAAGRVAGRLSGRRSRRRSAAA